MKILCRSLRLAVVLLFFGDLDLCSAVAEGSGGVEPCAPAEVDPIVKASAYSDKSVWSYSDKEPLPWTLFHPHDYGSTKIVFKGCYTRRHGA